jgi:hypothetical protein
VFLPILQYIFEEATYIGVMQKDVSVFQKDFEQFVMHIGDVSKDQ